MKIKLNFLAVALFLTAVNSGSSQPITFTKITSGAIVTDQGEFSVAAWGDFDNGGFLDLFVCRYAGTNDFYRNNGDATFTCQRRRPDQPPWVLQRQRVR
jgi:hypothetical protein